MNSLANFTELDTDTEQASFKMLGVPCFYRASEVAWNKERFLNKTGALPEHWEDTHGVTPADGFYVTVGVYTPTGANVLQAVTHAKHADALAANLSRLNDLWDARVEASCRILVWYRDGVRMKEIRKLSDFWTMSPDVTEQVRILDHRTGQWV
jgi:hypothetical protein